ncbi:hypothetical protein C5N14_26030 [Micromonospora sp. MW-13]|uniref:hypothetical protein n=1 Tax=Micromonospora sp. MW-13 TaxID=2094022 RepID=UPI000EF0AFB8|nr:hypothetical protein [Micromonospora sp. MW-13]RGC66029.1 hypothetical protein C5N14_26030 [Micromonospora sp. MW-13]
MTEGRHPMHHPERRLLISVDMERYSRRSNLQQFDAQQDFRRLLHEAARDVGLDRVAWSTQQAGDGELAILPRDAPEARVIGRFVPELNRRLRAYNASRVPAARIRLRIAVHQGLVHLDGANGFPGNAVVFVCRLCDAAPVKRALAAFPDAGVALVVSAEIFRDVVTEYPEEMRPERFRRVRVSHPDKGFEEHAWCCVVDEDLSSAPPLAGEGPAGLRPPGDPDDGPAPTPAPPGADRPGAGHPAGPGNGGIQTGDVRVRGQNAIGPNATAIGSVGRDAIVGRDGGGR